jgi:hypothetical protein
MPSITDGTVFCALCGDDRTGCNLCGTAPLTGRSNHRAPMTPARARIEEEEKLLWHKA